MITRFATPDDKVEVLNLLSQLGCTINETTGYDKKNENAITYGSKNFDEIINRDDIKIFLLENTNTIVGLASFFIYHDMITGDKYAHIDDFVIAKEHRHQGYGQLLMNEIIHYAKQDNFSAIKLISFPEAEEFYKKCGASRSNIAMKIDIQ